MITYYGEGVVTKSNDKGDNEIEISPIEIIKDMKGSIDAMKKSFKSSIKADNDALKGTTLQADYIIKANWFSFNSDRVTPPYVVAGEKVMILTIPHTDIYFWVQVRDKSLRKEEVVTYLYSNKDKAMDELSKKSAVMFSIDTKKKHITLTTPKNLGEPMTWEIDLDYKNALLHIKNSQGDLFSINGVKRHAQLTTTTVEIDAKDTTITGNLLVKKDVVIKGTLTVSKVTKLLKDLSVSGAASISKALSALKLSQTVKKIVHGNDHLH